jgi:hypothetical protein
MPNHCTSLLSDIFAFAIVVRAFSNWRFLWQKIEFRWSNVRFFASKVANYPTSFITMEQIPQGRTMRAASS